MRHRICTPPGAALFAALGLSIAAPAAQAQYFGRNKVQYETFDFKVLRTEHFDVYFYPEEAEAARLAARSAERWYARLTRVFRHELSGRQPLILYASAPEFRQTNAIPGELGEGTGGVTEALKRRIVMPIGGPLEDVDHVLGHELVHAFQYDITGQGNLSIQGLPGASVLPLWFIEGMAEYLSLGPEHPHTAMWLRDAVQHKFPRFRDLEDPRFFPYRYGHAFLAYVAGSYGDEVLGTLLRSAAGRRDVGAAIRQVLGSDPEDLVKRWEQATREAFQPVLAATRPAEEQGAVVVRPRDDEEGRYNVAPALSPDGTQLMLLSDRGLFSIDLYLADARTGEFRRQVTETAVDPHYSSIQFISSAGAWAPDGRRFAFAGVSAGRPLLAVYDVEENRVEREVRFPELGEIFSPTWSPDGRSVAFSGLAGGFLDLYIYDLEADSVRRVTDDPYSDLQPAWSPDGRTIAFASNRFTTSVDSLDPGAERIVLLDVATGRIRQAGPEEIRGKQINPQWSPDGTALYFLGDPQGITNVYRLDLAGSLVAQLTDLQTGVSGITDLSPALTVAQRSGEIVFSAYEKGGYGLFRLQGTEGAPLAYRDEPLPAAGVLPPHTRTPDGGYLATLRDPTIGLPEEEEFSVRPYRAGLSLDYIAQPTLAAGVSSFGTFVGGGTALFWSDMLGNHNLVTGLQVSGSLKDITALAGYTNLSRRLNWGVVAQQVPLLTGGYAAGPAVINGDTVFAEQTLLERQTNRQVAAIISYPFSQVQRIDFTASFLNIGFDRELRTRAFTFTGREVLDETRDLDAPAGLNLGQGSLALVYDNSLFGATSPILGQRYRLEVTPSFGSIDMVEGLVDFRRYFLPVRPFTLAMRVLHYGRYGGGGEDPRLTPLFLGYESLVRGYAYRSFDPSECDPSPGDPGGCPVFDQLLGSRMLVGNLELRFPLLGVLGAGGGYYGAFPLELALFGDIGVAWNRGEEPSFLGGDRSPVSSAGVAARLNLFGFAVAQVDLVRPFDRDEKGWIWQFSLQPGF